jgi:iron complex outermembrane receptor protein/hemoglobin/transferrin/lactoferrin receptor protein
VGATFVIAAVLARAVGVGEAPRDYRGPLAADVAAPSGPARVPAGAVSPQRAELPAEQHASAPTPGIEHAGASAMTRTVVVEARAPPRTEPDRASSVVSRRELEERLPRSAPDALRYEPGVYVQQTAHGQASPYVRGMTGQQTVIMFDGVRLNNSTFRQGPNQYFFTVDSRTIDELETIRGSASTRYGSDALGGAFLVRPIEPSLSRGPRAVDVHGRGLWRSATADGEVGGRAWLDGSYRGKLGVLGGVGYRDVGQLRSGGRFDEPATGEPQRVPPVFDEDGKTQRGTGFRELAADARMAWQPNDRIRTTLAWYDYRQLDGVRTDKCPPPTAPEDECLRYPEQFRDLAYGAIEVVDGPRAVERLRWTASFQEQHERRVLERGSPSATEVHGVDDVRTVGTGVAASTAALSLSPWASLRVRYGADGYYDWVGSRAWHHYADVDIVSHLSRGQYLDGARYLTSGLWSEIESELWQRLCLRVGGRGALVLARAEGDPASESASIDRRFATGVAHGGMSVLASEWLKLTLNANQGFRAPNLDDLTSRQQTGPGFQFENPELEPERSFTVEFGTRVEHARVELDTWLFRTTVDGLIARAPRDQDECPEGDPGCAASQTVFQLQNLADGAVIQGIEGNLRLFLPWDLLARATIAYAWGEGPNPVPPPATPRRLPLSRIPPLNGTGEFGWRSSTLGVYAVGVVRWARLQDRLALADEADPRIPAGGTPGFVAFDVRGGYRFDPHVLVGLVLENIGDAAYRYHGSSINAPGRGLIAHVEVGF